MRLSCKLLGHPLISYIVKQGIKKVWPLLVRAFMSKCKMEMVIDSISLSHLTCLKVHVTSNMKIT